MDLPESQGHSFIVKLWVEEAVWHGYITHVPGGERRYLKRLSDIVDFIKQFLGQMNVEPGMSSHIWRWLGRFNLSHFRYRINVGKLRQITSLLNQQTTRQAPAAIEGGRQLISNE